MGKDLNIDNLKGKNFPFEIYKDERSDSMEEWLVSDKTCKGCIFYGVLAPGYNSGRCCDYTFITNKVRHNKPAECEVKVEGLERSAGREMYKRGKARLFKGTKNSEVRSDG